jgi:hypothetical protein
MSTDYSSTELIASIKRRAAIPTVQNLFQDADFVDMASDELQSSLVPKMMAVREDYFSKHTDTLITSGTNDFAIPSRAVGQKLKDVIIVNSDGWAIQNLPRLSYTDISLYSPTDYVRLFGFYLEGTTLKLWPVNTWADKYLRIYYYRRPNRLVLPSQAGKVTNIVGTTVTVDNVPTTWTTGTLVDLIAGRPGFDSLADDKAITGVAGFDLSFASVPTGLQVGDWIAEAGESPVPQIPYEGFSWLAQATACKVVEAIGNTNELQVHQAKLKILEDHFMSVLSPRVDEEPKKIVSRKGIFRFGKFRSWLR